MKKLRVRVFRVEEGRPEVILNNEDAKDLGLHPRDRVAITHAKRSTVALVNVSSDFVKKGELGVMEEVHKILGVVDGDDIRISLAPRPRSVDYIRKKMRGESLGAEEYDAIVKDVVSNALSEVELTAFITSLYINEMSMEETAYLTKKMAENGEMLHLKKKPVFDKHSIGGVPGNKITLLIVPIVAAAGLTIPKTSSRAITSACGTADIMEVLAPVTFSSVEIEEIVNEVDGIIAWGGGVSLAPADDVFIQVEYPLAIDPHNLAICSVMAKKHAVGADYVVIDIPMGEGTKVRTMEEAKRFARDFVELGERIGINVECAITYGDKPIGRAVGPALEAEEALRALEGSGPSSLIEKATDIAGILLEAGGVANRGGGKKAAIKLLNDGRALEKMREIIGAQGGDPTVSSGDVKVGRHSLMVRSSKEGYVTHILNRAIVQIARTAGAPRDKGAGILLHVTKGRKVKVGDPLFEIYADSKYKLAQAEKLSKRIFPVVLEGMLLKRIPDYTIFEG
jgi:AMP phosphorylase